MAVGQFANLTTKADLEGRLQEIAERAMQATGSQGAAIALQQDGVLVTVASSASAPDVGVVVSSASFAGRCFESGGLLVCDDTDHDERVNPEACRSMSIRSMIAVPIQRGSTTLGVLAMFASTAERFGPTEIALSRTLAVIAGELLAAAQDAKSCEDAPASSLWVAVHDTPSAEPFPNEAGHHVQSHTTAHWTASPESLDLDVPATPGQKTILPPLTPLYSPRLASYQGPEARLEAALPEDSRPAAKTEPGAPATRSLSPVAKTATTPGAASAPPVRPPRTELVVLAAAVEPSWTQPQPAAPTLSGNTRVTTGGALPDGESEPDRLPRSKAELLSGAMFNPLEPRGAAGRKFVVLTAAFSLPLVLAGWMAWGKISPGHKAASAGSLVPGSQTEISQVNPRATVVATSPATPQPVTYAAGSTPATDPNSADSTATLGGVAKPTAVISARESRGRRTPEKDNSPVQVSQPTLFVRSNTPLPKASEEPEMAAPPIEARAALPTLGDSRPYVPNAPISDLVAPVLIRKVAPVYPAGIRGSHLQGTVVLQAVVLTDGTIGSIKTVSGDPMLRQAAAQAVKQWRYRPAYLNGKPQESSVSVEVVFPRSGEQ